MSAHVSAGRVQIDTPLARQLVSSLLSLCILARLKLFERAMSFVDLCARKSRPAGAFSQRESSASSAQIVFNCL